MIGLAYLVAFALYLAVTAWAARRAVTAARRRGIAGWKWGLPVAVGAYLLVFWDWIPTLVVYEYQCGSYGGAHVYKTANQWREQNNGVPVSKVDSIKSMREIDDRTLTYLINSRFRVVQRKTKLPVVPVVRTAQTLVDSQSGEILLQHVMVTAGYPALESSYKFWNNVDACAPELDRFGAQFNAYRQLQEIAP
jgi:hypothetical protein